MDITPFILGTLHNFEEVSSVEGHTYPVCPRRSLLQRLFPEKVEHTFKNRYNQYVSKALRSLVQQTWMKQELLWGDWRCTDLENCGLLYKNCFLQKCSRCGGEVSYLKKELEDPESGLKARVDGIVLCNDLRGFIPYKISCRNPKVIKERKGQEPYASDLAELAVFAKLLSTKVPVVAGRLVLWLNKANPTPFLHWFYPGVGDSVYESQVEAFKQLKTHAPHCGGDLSKLSGTCKENCSYPEYCFSLDRQNVVAERFKEIFGERHNISHKPRV